MNRKIFSVVGARPQFIKAAAVERSISKLDRFRSEVVHTGQHFDADMSDVFFDELEIPAPMHRLNISGGPHGQMTGRMLEALDQLFSAKSPDAVLVYGDTNSTLSGALAAAKLHIPVFHVEAGLRSFNRRMPEEINRVLTDHVSSLLFCPTEAAVDNLIQEGIRTGVHLVGDVMADATLAAKDRAHSQSRILEKLGLEGGEYILCTLHRAENTDDPARLIKLIEAVRKLASGRTILFPVHPRTAKVCAAHSISLDGFMTTAPLGYLDLQRLISGSALVACDSGGLQKEAYFHRRPCVTLREETEWVETIEAGWNRLWTSPDWKHPRKEIDCYGDGHAGDKIAQVIADYLDKL
jgi:UDP-GlcNAc3NAcA epimerase